MQELAPEYRGWWRIVDTSQWVNDGLDILGPALISLTGCDDRLRMHALQGSHRAGSARTPLARCRLHRRAPAWATTGIRRWVPDCLLAAL